MDPRIKSMDPRHKSMDLRTKSMDPATTCSGLQSYLKAPPTAISYIIVFRKHTGSLCFSNKLFSKCPSEKQERMCCKYIESLFWPRKNQGAQFCWRKKAPAEMGTPRPGIAKLRVSSERHSCCANQIAQWSGPRTAV